MSKRVKLTKPQRELLERIAVESIICDSGYKPAVKLVDLGFADFISRSYGSPKLQITTTGHAYLADPRA